MIDQPDKNIHKLREKMASNLTNNICHWKLKKFDGDINEKNWIEQAVDLNKQFVLTQFHSILLGRSKNFMF